MIAERVLARVATSEDEEFLRDLFFEIRAPEFVAAQLSPQQLSQLLTQQYGAMRSHYSRAYPEAVYSVFELDGELIGYEAVREIDEFHLIDISITQRFRNQGIGTGRLRLMMKQAQSVGKSVTLSVEVFNPAKRLYDRLGFKEYEEFGMYKRMRWSA